MVKINGLAIGPEKQTYRTTACSCTLKFFKSLLGELK
jgi:hypothetical protein